MAEKKFSYCPPRPVSYLQARDPSILSWNYWNRDKLIRHNLLDDFCKDSTICKNDSEIKEKVVNRVVQDEGLSVFLRIKGGVVESDQYKVENNVLSCLGPKSSQNSRTAKNGYTYIKQFTFSHIFQADSTQSDIFDSTIKEKVLGFINGLPCTLLAYGVSGAGKTFTMIGSAEQPGIIPRSLDYLFRTLSNHINKIPIVKPEANRKFQVLNTYQSMCEIDILENMLRDPHTHRNESVHKETFLAMERRLSFNDVGHIDNIPPILGLWVSFAEIYNENIYDLFQNPPARGMQRPKLKLAGLQNDTYIKDLKWVYVRNGVEAYELLQYGQQNLSYASTCINEHSSRSHCIFSIKLLSGFDENNCQSSVFNFCDLAGSERLKKTHNEGFRLKESMKINTSLSTLGRCITCIRNKQQNSKDCSKAPFRDSRLTQLFQKALQGKEDILMMVNINPSKDMFEETQHTLMFSAIAKDIVIKPSTVEPLVPVKEYESKNKELSELHKENDRLRQELSKYQYQNKEVNQVEEELRELRNDKAMLVLQLSELKQEIFNIIEKEMESSRKEWNELIAYYEKRIKELEPDAAAYQKIKRQENFNSVLRNIETACNSNVCDDEGDEDDCILVSDDASDLSSQYKEEEDESQ
ncbi:kinesin-like protein subito isoform X1 [Euwallacea fornicatus]|uniref:kinesin-like protein subito isoform X1 n=1 Tax=Euwallacea fornicatus TaxID=995702 RepID=UPI00338DA822